MKKFIPLLLVIPLLTMCKRDDINAPVDSNDCVPMEEPYPPRTQFYPLLTHIDFNPINQNELLLFIRNWGGRASIYRYNLETKEIIKLLEGTQHPDPRFWLSQSKPCWGAKDWIVINVDYGVFKWDIFKIKSNGENLTRLTFSENLHGPVWNLSGDKFICQVGQDHTNPTVSIIFDEQGNPLDTIEGGKVHSWRHDSLCIFSKDSMLVVKRPGSATQQFSIPINNVEFSGNADWIDDERFVWSDDRGVFRTNYRTGQTVQVIESCNTVTYSSPSFSKVLNKVFFVRFTTSFPDSNIPGVLECALVQVDPFDGSIEEIEIDGF